MGASKRLVSPPFQVSFPVVFKPKAFEGGEPKYSVCAVWTPSKFSDAERAQWENLLKAVDAVALETFGKKMADCPKNIRSPFRDGEEKAHLQGFSVGDVFTTLSSRIRPGVVDRDLTPIVDDSEFYPGCFARATVSVYAYNNVTRGVAIGLHNLQKVGDDTPLDGRTNASDDFSGLETPDWGETPATVADDELLG